jgi:hypothetical protein
MNRYFLIIFALLILPNFIFAKSIVPDLKDEFDLKYIEAKDQDIKKFKSLVEDYSPLYDPFSIQVRDLKLIEPAFGYCARVNAKNRGGGYGGWRFVAFVNTNGPWDYLSTGFKSQQAAMDTAVSQCSVMRTYSAQQQCQREILSDELEASTVWTYCGQGNTFLGKEKYLNMR